MYVSVQRLQTDIVGQPLTTLKIMVPAGLYTLQVRVCVCVCGCVCGCVWVCECGYVSVGVCVRAAFTSVLLLTLFVCVVFFLSFVCRTLCNTWL